MKKRLVLILLALAAVVILAVAASRGHGDIVVYYTNDIHSYIDNHLDEDPGLSYSKVAALKNTTENALLVDAGDHLQGTAYGGILFLYFFYDIIKKDHIRGEFFWSFIL